MSEGRLGERVATAEPAAMGEDFEDLFENAPCAYLLADKDGRIARANQTFGRWTGFSPEILVGRRFSDLLTIGGKLFYETHFAPALHLNGSFNEVALDIVASDDSWVPMFVNAVERRDAAGTSFIRFTLFVATARRLYERSLKDARDEAEAMVATQQAASELREQFVAVLSHDLRNPLAAIGSGVRLLGEETLSERGEMILGLMGGSVVRAVALVENVLDFARARLGGGLILSRNADEPLQPVLEQVVAEMRTIAPEQIVEARYNIDTAVDCDRVRIGQLLSNLLGNALTHGAKEAPVRLNAYTDAGLLVIAVSNSGAPIPLAAREHLFEPFFRGGTQRHHEGLGLGLHIASEIAKEHGGVLAVRSDEVETIFTFTMPLLVDAAETGKSASV